MPRSKYQKIRFFSSLLFTFLSKPWILRQCLPCIFWMPRPQKLSLGAIVSWDEALEIIFLKTFFPTKSSKNGIFFFWRGEKFWPPKTVEPRTENFFIYFSKENAIRTCVFKDFDYWLMPRSKYQKMRFFKIETIYVPIKTIGTSDSVYPVSFECKGLRNYR